MPGIFKDSTIANRIVEAYAKGPLGLDIDECIEAGYRTLTEEQCKRLIASLGRGKEGEFTNKERSRLSPRCPICPGISKGVLDLIAGEDGLRALKARASRLADQSVAKWWRFDADPALRAQMLDEIADMGAYAAHTVPTFMPALTDENTAVRASAAQAVGAIGAFPDFSTAALVRALNDSKATVRIAAAEALGKFGERALKAAPHLNEAIADPDFGVRYNAVNALASIGPKASPLLISSLSLSYYNNFWIKEALVCLAKNDPWTVQLLVSRMDDESLLVAEEAIDVLNQAGRLPIEPLLDKLALGNVSERAMAARSLPLIESCDTRVEPAIIEAMSDEEAAVRKNAVDALGALRISGEKVENRLFDAFDDEDLEVELTVAFVLSAMSSSRFKDSDQILQAMRSPSPAARITATLASRSILLKEPEKVIKGIENGLRDKNAKVRKAAAWAYGMMPFVPARESSLKRMIYEDDDPGCRRMARWALERLRPANPFRLGQIFVGVAILFNA